MGLLKSFISQTRKPEGVLGKLMVGGMNGSGTSRYISTNAIAVRIAVTVMRRIMALRRSMRLAYCSSVIPR